MKTIQLTDDQMSLMNFYILMTTKYREDEIKACSELAQEKKEDGSIKYPSMKSNAEWWENTNRELNYISTVISQAETVED